MYTHSAIFVLVIVRVRVHMDVFVLRWTHRHKYICTHSSQIQRDRLRSAELMCWRIHWIYICLCNIVNYANSFDSSFTFDTVCSSTKNRTGMNMFANNIHTRIHTNTDQFTDCALYMLTTSSVCLFVIASYRSIVCKTHLNSDFYSINTKCVVFFTCKWILCFNSIVSFWLRWISNSKRFDIFDYIRIWHIQNRNRKNNK